MVYPTQPRVVYVKDDVGVQFEYLIGGLTQGFVVSREALEGHFGLDLTGFPVENRDNALLEAFERGWERIRNVAARDRRVPSSVPIVLMSRDF